MTGDFKEHKHINDGKTFLCPFCERKMELFDGSLAVEYVYKFEFHTMSVLCQTCYETLKQKKLIGKTKNEKELKFYLKLLK